MQLTPINKHFKACDQQWDNMPEKENGRHCQQCDRVLVDLTDKTEQQVLDLQVQHNFKLCGRYTLEQVHRLDRYLTLQEQPKRNYMPWLVKLAMGLGASGAPLLAAAQQPVPSSTIEQAYPNDTTINIYPGYHSPWVEQQITDSLLNGSVQNEYREALPLSNVSLLNDNGSLIAETSTGLLGEFEFKFSKEIIGQIDDKTWVEVSKVGYEPQRILLKDLKQGHVFSLNAYIQGLETVVIEGERFASPIMVEVVGGFAEERVSLDVLGEHVVGNMDVLIKDVNEGRVGDYSGTFVWNWIEGWFK